MFLIPQVNITHKEQKGKTSEVHIDWKALQEQQNRTATLIQEVNPDWIDKLPPIPFKDLYEWTLKKAKEYELQDLERLEKKERLAKERKLLRDIHYEATGEYIDPLQKPFEDARFKEQKVLMFQATHQLRHFRKKGVKPIIPASFWTVNGRKRIVRNIIARIKSLQRRLNTDRTYVITLTYAKESDYRKTDITRFTNSFFRPFKRHHITYYFFRISEFQRRGVIHHHIVVSVRRDQLDLYWDYFKKERIDKLWRKGFTWIKPSNGGSRPAINYAVKYMTKQYRIKDDLGNFTNDYAYLNMVAEWKYKHGQFRLYSMTITRRFPKGMRGYLNQQYIKNPPRMYEHPEMLVSFIGGMYNGKWLTHTFHEEITEEGDNHAYEIPVKIDDWIAKHAPWLFGWNEKRTYNIEPVREYEREPKETDTDLQGEIDIEATWRTFTAQLRGKADGQLEEFMELINF